MGLFLGSGMGSSNQSEILNCVLNSSVRNRCTLHDSKNFPLFFHGYEYITSDWKQKYVKYSKIIFIYHSWIHEQIT